MKFKLTFILSFIICSHALAQSASFGSWLMGFNQTRLTDKVSLHSEFQIRNYNLLLNTQQLLLRGGMNYHVNKSTSGSFGYAYIGNYGEDKELQPGTLQSEHRIWQQFILKNKINRVSIEHRYRVEQRFINKLSSNYYQNRLRYLVRVNVPLNNTDIKSQTFFLSFYNEIFMNLLEKPFDRNRLYGALAYQFSDNTSLQLGILNQRVKDKANYYLQTAFFYNLDFRK